MMSAGNGDVGGGYGDAGDGEGSRGIWLWGLDGFLQEPVVILSSLWGLDFRGDPQGFIDASSSLR
jgi:hypothetical protein